MGERKVSGKEGNGKQSNINTMTKKLESSQYNCMKESSGNTIFVHDSRST